ncbi:hypothetical protein HAX54_044717 [Datura stramonium]|uniref:Uncharacterized protein n=1 Tax=Datura stramonium TaxID=4076 RepID=A0ABS8WIZ2_DATST|nr:hypothetical protein [Datura stramonium]
MVQLSGACRPQVTIATAIIFCHRFFLRQSHSRNDRRFTGELTRSGSGHSGRSTETPAEIDLKCWWLPNGSEGGSLASPELKLLTHKVCPAGKVEETPRPLKDVILVSYEIIHKKDPAAIQRIKQKGMPIGLVVVLFTGYSLCVNMVPLPAVWNFVNDGLRTSLCLQFKPHHIAAGAIFLAAKFLSKVPPQASEAEGSAGGNQRPAGKSSAAHEEHAANNSNSLGGGANTSAGTSNPASSSEIPDQPYADNHSGLPRTAHNSNNDYGSAEHNFSDGIGDGEINDRQKHDREQVAYQGSAAEVQSRSRYASESNAEDDQEGNTRKSWNQDIKGNQRNWVKAALRSAEVARDVTKKTDVMDDDDLIERELEDGIELAAGNEKNKWERKESWPKPSNRPEHENTYHAKLHDEAGDGHHQGSKGYRSPKLHSRKRKASSPQKTDGGKAKSIFRMIETGLGGLIILRGTTKGTCRKIMLEMSYACSSMSS